MTSLLRWSSLCVVATLAGCGGSSASTEGAGDSSATQGATSNSGGEAAASSGAQGEEAAFPMATAEFLGAVTAQAAPELCADASPLRTCYPSIDAQLCTAAFAQAMTSCGQAMASTLPPTVDEESADPVATAVATCARTAYQSGLEQAGVQRTTDCPLVR